MSQEHPELIFVSGPQAGQRVELSRPALVLGRGNSADVLLSEDYASRQQARYELMGREPTLENLSAHGTWINGKRYKKGKRVVLETGDLIGAGRETEILFVAAGDDVGAALATYEASASTGKNAFGRKPKAPPKPEEPPAVEAEAEPAAPAEAASPPGLRRRRQKRPSEMTAGERAEVEEKVRRRKIVVGLGIYFGVILAVGIVLWAFLRADGAGETGMPPVLRPQEIEDALAAVPTKTPNRLLMEKQLEEAIGLYRQYGLESVHLYRCVQTFKDALAYSGGEYFEETETERAYRTCLKRLTERITEKYRNACLFEKAQDWPRAEVAFRELRGILADENDPDFEKNPLFINVQAHYKRVQLHLRAAKPAKRGPWF